MKHPGIDDVQSSSFAGLTAGGVECNSTIPGEGTIPWYVPHFSRITSQPGRWRCCGSKPLPSIGLRRDVAHPGVASGSPPKRQVASTLCASRRDPRQRLGAALGEGRMHVATRIDPRAPTLAGVTTMAIL
jgi:hypothetical protein